MCMLAQVLNGPSMFGITDKRPTIDGDDAIVRAVGTRLDNSQAVQILLARSSETELALAGVVARPAVMCRDIILYSLSVGLEVVLNGLVGHGEGLLVGWLISRS